MMRIEFTALDSLYYAHGRKNVFLSVGAVEVYERISHIPSNKTSCAIKTTLHGLRK